MTEIPESIVHYDNKIPLIEGRDPTKSPDCHIVRDLPGHYKIMKGRRKSSTFLVNNIRTLVDKWRDEGYPGVTDTTKELLIFWFESEHIIKGRQFNFWFCQREAIETLIYLFEVKKFNDFEQVIHEFAQKEIIGILGSSVEIIKKTDGSRDVFRYFSELKQMGNQEIPEEGLLKYAFKMATGSGKTIVMALIIVWSYFNNIKEGGTRYSNNFLIVPPNVIVYERLARDFRDNKIFYDFPFIPNPWKSLWNLKVTLRDDDSPLAPSGNIILANIQQLYESRVDGWTPANIAEAFLGRPPQKNLTKSPIMLLDRIKDLTNLLVINDEAHHVHDTELKWHETLISIHRSLPKGITLWLDFSATPKTQTGVYYAWTIVDYPLAQAVEDRIVKAPIIVHRVNKNDPTDVSQDNVIEKYGEWLLSSIHRWKVHYDSYSGIGKKPILFIMSEKSVYADKIAEFIQNNKSIYDFSKDEILVIHTDTSGDIKKSDLEQLRRVARDVDNPTNKIKVISSVLMLREGWDVQNVTVCLGLRPYTAQAKILPEQTIGRGLRIMGGITPDYIQTLEVMGTNEFEKFVKDNLEQEGVNIETVHNPPPQGVTISVELSRLKYDIEIPQIGLRYNRNYKKLSEIDINSIPNIFTSNLLKEEWKSTLRMEFATTGTGIHEEDIEHTADYEIREKIAYIVNNVMKKAGLTCQFNEICPVVEGYILNKCFDTKISSIDSICIKNSLSRVDVSEGIISVLAQHLGELTAEKTDILILQKPIKLSETEVSPWNRKHTRLDKTIFNYVAVYNNFEEEFATFLDRRFLDIARFASLATTIFKIDYLSSKGATRFYHPDFVAVQNIENKKKYWIIETKGREYEDVGRKDEAITRWCQEVSEQTGQSWNYLKIPQVKFDYIKERVTSFENLVKRLSQ